MTKYLELILLCFLFISGCGVPTQPSTPANGELVLVKPIAGGGTSCLIDAIFHNQSEKTVMEPQIKLIFFDQWNNTLSTYSISFDPILAGKNQSKQAYVSGMCDILYKAQVLEAIDNHLHLSGYALRIPNMPEGKVINFKFK